jgi:adenylate kinase family enzyme
MRISIIGNSGSGKSTIARSLAAMHGLATLDLDSVAWEPGKIAVARDPMVAAVDVTSFCEASPNWVVEGCYGNLIAATLQYSPVLLFVEPGVEMCLANCRARPWEPHKYQSKQEQDVKLEFLLAWVRDYYTRQGDLSLVGHQALFDNYGGVKHKLVGPPGSKFLTESAAWET